MSAKYLVAAMLAVAVAAPLPAQSVKAGIDAWQRADYPGAIAIWRPLAEAGDADAQFNLGQAYRLGRGVPLDLSVAKVWFERAARSGHVDAETTLGLLTFQNGDRVAGLKWLRAAADQGEPRALLVYGTALFNGDGVPQDRVLAYALVSRAAAQGLAPAQETLAQLNQLMPVSERQKAVAMAQAKAKYAPPPSSKPKPAKVATAKPPAVKASPPAATAVSGGWRIQLGAFSQRASAETLYQRVSAKPALAGRIPYYVTNGFGECNIGIHKSGYTGGGICGSNGTCVCYDNYDPSTCCVSPLAGSTPAPAGFGTPCPGIANKTVEVSCPNQPTAPCGQCTAGYVTEFSFTLRPDGQGHFVDQFGNLYNLDQSRCHMTSLALDPSTNGGGCGLLSDDGLWLNVAGASGTGIAGTICTTDCSYCHGKANCTVTIH